MKQFFILGRNPILSKEEIYSYLNARNIKFKEIHFEENLLIIELNEKIPIQELGGTIRSGEILFDAGASELERFFEREEIVPSDKFSYAVYGNLDPIVLKEKFKSERKKATLKHGKSSLKLQSGEKIQNPNADFDILFTKGKKNIYLGLSNQDYDYSNVKIRDMQKPVRREALAISPRLSKILINLSGAKKGDLLLDPFCGVGAILSEAVIKGINAYGIDKDKEAIQGAKRNLEWLKQKFEVESYAEVENNDSRFAPDKQYDAVATETPLGVLLKKKPSDKESGQIVEQFESLIIPILRRLKTAKRPKARIAITFPAVNNKRPNVPKICEKTGLRLIIGPIEESRPSQFIKREIIVFE